MTRAQLRIKFEDETGCPWMNEQEEPDIDYVMWLEGHLIDITEGD